MMRCKALQIEFFFFSAFSVWCLIFLFDLVGGSFDEGAGNL
jgi:hypothetical protein